MKNAAGDIFCDKYLEEELQEAGIDVLKLKYKQDGEVPAKIQGELLGWHFERAWYYWMANGPEIPFDVAEALHSEYGEEVRVDGHAGCPSPIEWYGIHKDYNGKMIYSGVPHYHIDTQRGLNAIANAIRNVYGKENK